MTRFFLKQVRIKALQNLEYNLKKKLKYSAFAEKVGSIKRAQKLIVQLNL